ncbi:hypothetical protein ICG15_001978, partial [Neisseria gonorrhoeae]
MPSETAYRVSDGISVPSYFFLWNTTGCTGARVRRFGSVSIDTSHTANAYSDTASPLSPPKAALPNNSLKIQA